MAPLSTVTGVDISEFKETALKDLCNLLEGVRTESVLSNKIKGILLYTKAVAYRKNQQSF